MCMYTSLNHPPRKSTYFTIAFSAKRIWCRKITRREGCNNNWLIETLVQWPFKSLDYVIITVHIRSSERVFGVRVIISKLTYTHHYGRTYVILPSHILYIIISNSFPSARILLLSYTNNNNNHYYH